MRRKNNKKKIKGIISLLLVFAMIFTMGVAYMPTLVKADDVNTSSEATDINKEQKTTDLDKTSNGEATLKNTSNETNLDTANEESEDIDASTNKEAKKADSINEDTTSKDNIEKSDDIKAPTEKKTKSPNRRVVSGSDSNNSLLMEVGSDEGFKDVDTVGNTANWAITFAGTVRKQIRITPTFSDVNVMKTRSIKVVVPKGMKILEYTTVSGTAPINGVNQLSLSSTDDPKVNTSLLTATDGSPWVSQKIENVNVMNTTISNSDTYYGVYDGMVNYTFNPNCNKVSLLLTLDVDTRVLPHDSSTCTLSDITVDMTSGTDTLNEHLTPTITNISPTCLYSSGTFISSGVIDSMDDTKGTYDEFYVGNLIRTYGAEGNYQNHFAKTLTYTTTYPEGLELDYIKFGGSQQAPRTGTKLENPGTYGNGHIVYTLDTTTRTVKLELTNVLVTDCKSLYLYFKPGTVDGTNIQWYDENQKAISCTFNVTEVSGSYLGDAQTKTYNFAPVTSYDHIMKPVSSATITPTNLAKTDLNKDGDYPYTYSLSGWAVSVDGTVPLYNTKFIMTFSPNICVRDVTLPSVGDIDTSRTMPIKVWTNKTGDTPRDCVANPTAGYSFYIGKFLGLADDEYILKLEIDYGELWKVSYVPTQYEWAPFTYRGKFIEGQTGPATLQITSDKFNSEVVTDEARIATDALTTFSSAGTLTTRVYNNAAHTTTGSFSPGDKMYFQTNVVRGEGTRNNTEFVDPVFYIRLPKGLSLDESSLKVNSKAGNGNGALTDMAVTNTWDESEDSNGVTWKIYQVSVKNKYDIICQENGADVDYKSNSASLYYTVNVNPACTTYAQIPTTKLCYVDFGASGGYNFNYIGHFYGGVGLTELDSIIGKADDYQLLDSYYQVTNVSIYQKPAFETSLGIRVEGSGSDFGTYDGTESTIAPVTPDLPAEVQLTWQNTSDNPFYAGSEIYMPIPKANVDYAHYFANGDIKPTAEKEADGSATKDEQWSAELTGAITLPGFTTYYTTDTDVATNYTSGAINNSWVPYGNNSIWTTSPSDYKDVTMVKFVATSDIPAVGSTSDGTPTGTPTDRGSTTFILNVSDSSQLGQNDFWRTYQKGWTTAAGDGTWNYGAIVAATPSNAGVVGKVFNDKNQNGIMDTGEAYTALPSTSLHGVLTEKDGKISALPITINADGSFRTLTATGQTYYLKEGDYTLTIYNDSASVNDANKLCFTDKSSTAHSVYKDETKPDEGINWYMDVAQDDIASDDASSTYEFKINADSLMTELVGVGVLKTAKVTYTDDGTTSAADGTSITFADVTEYINPGKNPSASLVPQATIGTSGTTKDYYNKDTLYYTADKDLALKSDTTFAFDVTPVGDGEEKVASGDTFASGKVIPTGTKLTRSQVLNTVVDKDITFTAHLDLLKYTVSYNGLTGATPSSISDLTGLTYSSASLLPTRNIGGTITGITPSKKGYIFNGWKVTTNGSTTFTGYVGVNNTISDIIGDWTVTNLTLTASFTPYPITVSYTGLDDVTYTPATVSTSGEYDGTLTSPGSDPVKSGYTFKGWKSVDATTPFNWTFDSSSSITTLASSSLLITDNGVKLDNTNHTGTLTLEAQWKMNDYSTITASNFEYGVKTSTYDGTSNTPLTKAVVLKYSNFSAKDSSLNELPDEYISVDSDELDTINKAIEQGNGALNQYPLHINNTLNNTEKVIYVILQDVGDDIKMANTRLSGNNIVLGIDEWKDKELTKDDLMYRISANGVVANSEISRTALTGNDTEFTAIKDAIANNTTGIYPFTINTTNGSIKVNVVIKEKASGVYPSLKSDNSNIEGSIDKGDIGANNIRISKSDEFNADIAKTLCAVEAKDKWANDIALADIGVDADQLSAITSAQNLDATGNYPLRFYIIRTGEEVTINVALYSSTVTDPVTGITLWANNFSYDVDNKTALTKDITKNLSSVIGFNLEGTQLEPEKILVDDESFNALFEKYSNKQVGTYDLTFTSTNEQGTASITIKVTLYQNKPQVVGDGGDTHIDGGGNTGDDHDSGTTDPKTKTKVVYKLISYVKTGDMNNIILLVVLLAMATITGIIIVRKKVKR